MNRDEQIARLDLDQAKVNFEIETDTGRHDDPPKMEFDRMGICKNCDMHQASYETHIIRYWCKKTMAYWHKRMVFCDMNKEVARVMGNGFNTVTEDYIDGLSLEMVLVYCHIYGIDHDKDQWLDDEYESKENDLKVALMDKMCK